MRPALTEITSDLYDICWRIKQIDADYQIFFDRQNCCFEVHNKRQGANTFCLKVPFSRLDQRTVDLIFQTRKQNADKILADIETHNQKVFEAQKQAALDKAADFLTQ